MGRRRGSTLVVDLPAVDADSSDPVGERARRHVHVVEVDVNAVDMAQVVARQQAEALRPH